MDRTTFTNQRDISANRSKAVELLQLWQELRAREMTAQQHNRQLLQQFEEAQHTLREMLTLTKTMKTIRMEYERRLEESSPQWQQQVKEKTPAPPRERMEDILKSCLKTREVAKSSVDELLLSRGPTSNPQNIAAPQKHYRQNSHLDDSRDVSPRLPHMQPPHPQPQEARLPIRLPFQVQGSSHIPPSVLPPPMMPFESQLRHIPSVPSHHHLWPKQDPPGRASSQPDYRWSGWTAGAAGIPSGSECLWGQLYVEEPPPEREVAQAVGEEAERNTTASSYREREAVSRSCTLSQELDVKPVRLTSGPAETSETSRASSQGSREKMKRRGRLQCASSSRGRHSSQETSRTSSAKVGAAVTVVQNSESDVSSEKGRTRRKSRGRSAGLATRSPKAEKVANRDDEEESHPASEESRRGKADEQSSDKSESCSEESGPQQEAEHTETGGEKSDSSEESGVAEKDEDEHEKDPGEGNEEGDGDNQRVEEQEERDDNVFENQITTDEEETGPEEEQEEEEGEKEETSVMLENEEDGKRGSASTHDEEDKDDGEGDEKEVEDGEPDKEEERDGAEREEQRRDEAGEPEERDSEDSIISPQNKSIKRHIIPEEASRTGSSDDDDSSEISDDDIEHLLAPQERPQKEEEDLRADEKPEALSDKVEIFQVETDTSTKTDHASDSEFGHFYD